MRIDKGEESERMLLTHLFTSENDGSTPLEDDEKQGLIPSWVSFRHELNEIEQENIARATLWAFRQEQKPSRQILDEQFIRSLHKQMLKDVWKRAGTFRITERNIGVAPYRIAPDLQNLIEDAKVWLELTSYAPDEVSARFHHRLVSIHPFPNGNGRHARLMADLLARRLKIEPFSWGGRELTTTSELRAKYIQSLQLADRGQIANLVEFMRS